MLIGSISSSGGDSVIGSCTDVSGCSACDAVLFSVAVGFFFCGAGFGFGGGLFGFRRSRTVSSRSLFFFLSSSRIAGRSSFGIEASATICSSVALICPVGSLPAHRAPLLPQHQCLVNTFRHVVPSQTQHHVLRRFVRKCVFLNRCDHFDHIDLLYCNFRAARPLPAWLIHTPCPEETSFVLG